MQLKLYITELQTGIPRKQNHMFPHQHCLGRNPKNEIRFFGHTEAPESIKVKGTRNKKRFPVY